MKKFFSDRIAALFMVSTIFLLAAGTVRAAVGEGSKFPDFELQTLDGKKISNKNFQGKIVIVDFWASWCEPCKVELPALNDLYAKYKRQGVEVVGINVDETPEEAKNFLKAHPVRFSSAFDGKDKKLIGKVDVQAMPSSFILDRKGTIRFIHKGFRSGDIEKFEKEVQTLLKKK